MPAPVSPWQHPTPTRAIWVTDAFEALAEQRPAGHCQWTLFESGGADVIASDRERTMGEAMRAVEQRAGKWMEEGR